MLNVKPTDKVKLVYESIALKYEVTFKGENEFIDKFAEFLSPGSRILDLGCGTGEDVKFLAIRRFRVVGIDFSRKMISIAKKKVPEAKFCLMRT